MSFKDIEHWFLALRRTHGNNVFVRHSATWLRRAYHHPWFARFSRRYLVWPEVARSVQDITGVSVDPALYKEAMASSAFTLSFDRYHSRDFTTLFLYAYVRTAKPTVIIETGISSGRSSTALLEALERNGSGTLYSLDLPKLTESGQTTVVHGEKGEYRQYIPVTALEPGWLVPQSLQHNWHKILGDSNVTLPKLVETLSSVDVFFHDSDHTDRTMMHEFTVAWPKIPSGGLLLADDVHASQAFEMFTREHSTMYRHIYNGLGIAVKQ